MSEKEKKKTKRSAEFTTDADDLILHLHFMGCPLGSSVVNQIEVEG